MTYKHDKNHKVRYNMTKFLLSLEFIIIDFLLFFSKIKFKIPKIIINNFWFIISLLFLIIPPILCEYNEWEIPSIYVLYAFIMGFVFLIKFATLRDQSNNSYFNDDYELENDDYIVPRAKSYKRIYDPLKREKDKNGGLTDKEVKERKKDIWKKLAN